MTSPTEGESVMAVESDVDMKESLDIKEALNEFAPHGRVIEGLQH
jgi:hypothetical protein